MPLGINYCPSERNLILNRSNFFHLEMNVPDPDIRDRSEYQMRLDSMLDYETVASIVVDRF